MDLRKGPPFPVYRRADGMSRTKLYCGCPGAPRAGGPYGGGPPGPPLLRGIRVREGTLRRRTRSAFLPEGVLPQLGRPRGLSYRSSFEGLVSRRASPRWAGHSFPSAGRGFRRNSPSTRNRTSSTASRERRESSRAWKAIRTASSSRPSSRAEEKFK